MKEILSRYGVNLVGGDTVKSQTLTIDVTMLGEAPLEAIRYRHGAKPGDVIMVTGNLASPYVGIWELAWMPAMNLVGGYVAWFVGTKTNPYAGSAFLAVWISVAVAVMLTTVLGLPFWPTFVAVLVPDAILVIGGVPVMRWVSP